MKLSPSGLPSRDILHREQNWYKTLRSSDQQQPVKPPLPAAFTAIPRSHSEIIIKPRPKNPAQNEHKNFVNANFFINSLRNSRPGQYKNTSERKIEILPKSSEKLRPSTAKLNSSRKLASEHPGLRSLRTAPDSLTRPSRSLAHLSHLYRVILEKIDHQKPDWVQWDEATTPINLCHWINNPTKPQPVNCHAAVAMCLYLLEKIKKEAILEAASSYDSLLKILGIENESSRTPLPLPLYDQLPAYAVVIFDDENTNIHLGLSSGNEKIIHHWAPPDGAFLPLEETNITNILCHTGYPHIGSYKEWEKRPGLQQINKWTFKSEGTETLEFNPNPMNEDIFVLKVKFEKQGLRSDILEEIIKHVKESCINTNSQDYILETQNNKNKRLLNNLLARQLSNETRVLLNEEAYKLFALETGSIVTTNNPWAQIGNKYLPRLSVYLEFCERPKREEFEEKIKTVCLKKPE